MTLLGTIMSQLKPVISIIGTTGVGKSDLSIQLAKTLGGEVINADSMQMYKDLPQITNKHPVPERGGVPHHIMDHIPWTEEYDIHKFEEDCLAKIEDIQSRGKVPILVGGTHYYLQSVLYLNKTIEKRGEGRPLTEEQKSVLNEGTPEEWHRLLMKYDPTVATKFHPNDSRRIRRALEVYYTMGKPASEIYREQVQKETDESKLRFNTLFLWLYSQPKVLEERLDRRVDKMFEQGALNELADLYKYYESLDPKPVKMDRGVFQAIGFKEFMPYLEKNGTASLSDTAPAEVIADPLFHECMEQMKLRTRQYARRQVKWIKNKLIPDMAPEEKHGWKNGGKVYIMDATDLSQWDSQVADRGRDISKEFIEEGKVSPGVAQVPEGLEAEALTKRAKEKFDESKWVYHTCKICKDKEGKPLVLVGDQWPIHQQSRRHRQAIKHSLRAAEVSAAIAEHNKKTKEEEQKKKEAQ